MFQRWAAVAAVSVLAVGSAARADDKPAYGPPAPWVKVAEVPAPPGDDQAPAVQAVLDDTQALLGQEGLFRYVRRIARVTKPEGLSSPASSSPTRASAANCPSIRSRRPTGCVAGWPSRP